MGRRPEAGPRVRRWRAVALGGVLVIPLLTAACSSTATPSGVVNAIGAENEYADVLSQVGGRYVHVSSILNDPNTDPHAFESSPSIAREVSAAQLIVQNGVGYDDFMGKIESASPNPGRRVVVVQRLLGLADGTPDPHLWYDPKTMPRVAQAMADDLAELAPSHAAYFRANAQKFDDSLAPWLDAVASFRSRYGGTAVATTEPVADYLLEAMGLDNLTPSRFEADVMNGVDPSPEDVSVENGLLSSHRAKVLLYNQQVVDALTASIRKSAQGAGIPVVGVYETMPTPGYHYESWMLAEVRAIESALAGGKSTERL